MGWIENTLSVDKLKIIDALTTFDQKQKKNRNSNTSEALCFFLII